MNELKQKSYFKWLYSLALNLVYFIIFLILFDLKYEMPDDIGYAEFIANGCYDFGFINYFVCFLMGTVSKCIYPINAYVITFLFLSVVSFTYITKIFIDKFSYLYATLMTFFIISFFAVNHYEVISFTRMPVLLSVAGFLSILHYSTEKYKSISGIAVGIILVIFAAGIRFEIFLVSSVMLSLYLLGKSILDKLQLDNNNHTKNSFFKIIFERNRLIALFLCFVLSFSLYGANKLIINNSEELKYYSKYTSVRSAVWDHKIPDYLEAKEEYDAIGLSENDIEMIRYGYFDSEVITLEKLYEVQKIQKNYYKGNTDYFLVLKEMIVSEIGNIKTIGDKGVALFAYFIVLLLFIILMKKRNLFIPIFMALGTFSFYYYLWIIARVPFRTIYVLLFAPIVYMFYSLDLSEFKKSFQSLFNKHKLIINILITIVCIPISLCGLYLSDISNKYNEYIVNNDSNKSSLLAHYINNNKEYKYEFSRAVSIPEVENDVFVQTFSSTYGELPYTIEQNRKFGSENLYSYLLDDKVCFVDSNDNLRVDMFRQYLQEHYSGNRLVSINVIKKLSDCTVYKFLLE